LSSLIATCAYESARPFVPAWIEGAITAARGRDSIEALIVIDGLESPATAFSQLSAEMTVHFVYAPIKVSIPASRYLMLKTAHASRADNIIFCDTDDVLTSSAIEQHENMLKSYDISVGDLMPISDRGDPLEPIFFGKELPDIITVSMLSESNVFGFSNTAVRRSVLAPLVGTAIPDVTAVDWWVFTTLIDGGARAGGDRGVVAKYRQHKENTLGALAPSSLEVAQRRLRIAAEHYRALGTTSSLLRAQAAQELAVDARLVRILDNDSRITRAWFSDVARWLDMRRHISTGPTERSST
jgi:hypothetical protein